MNLSGMLRMHVEIVRKHWLLVLVVAALVAAGGWYYHSRQLPLFEARTKLKIIRRAPRAPTAEVTFSFEEDQVFYNTQYNLLRTQLEWAELALDRAAWLVLDRCEELRNWQKDPDGAGLVAAKVLGDGLAADVLTRLGAPAEEADFERSPAESMEEDLVAVVSRFLANVGSSVAGEDAEPLRRALDAVRRDLIQDRWGYSLDSFLGSVEANPVPGTYLVELTFRAGDKSLAVFFANLYSELYRDVSREEREEILTREIEKISRRQEKLEADVKQANAALNAFKDQHPELSSSLRTNEPKRIADFVAQEINKIETELIVRVPEEDGLESLLEESGVEVVESEDGDCVVQFAEEQAADADIHVWLARNQDLLEHPAVAEKGSIVQLRERLRGFERERFDLPKDLTEESPQVRRLKALIEETSRELGLKVEAILCRYFDEARRMSKTLEKLEERFEEKAAAARALDKEYTRLERLEANVEALEDREDAFARAYEALTQADKSGGSSDDSLNVQNIEIERRARFQDSRQIRPNTALTGMVTAVMALLLAVGAAYLLEFLDDSIKTKADIDRFIVSPQIGLVPRIGAREAVETAVLRLPQSPVAEACRSIRTAILFSKRDEEIRSFAVTSATQGEGKTTICANLAVTMSQARRGKVLLIDADLRQARIHGVFGLENRIGLTNCLIGNTTLAEAVQETDVPELDVLTSGPIPPNPAELLGGHQLASILEEARGTYGKIIIDTTPVLPVTDASLVAPLVDGVFLVVSAGKISRRLVIRAKETLAAIGVVVSGVILNCIRSSPTGYDFRYGYPSRDEGESE